MQVGSLGSLGRFLARIGLMGFVCVAVALATPAAGAQPVPFGTVVEATPPLPPEVGSYSNAAIADKALTYVGQNRGQCREFVNSVVSSVSNGTQNTGQGWPDYFAGFVSAGGTRVSDVGSLVKGDIVQIGQTEADSRLHTTIIVKRVSGSTFEVVDSNSRLDGVVRRYNRTITLSSSIRAYRMGRVTSDNPVGSFDSATSPEPGRVRVGGWAFDPNALTSPVTIHVYVGGPAGSAGAEGRSIGPASGSRPDVGRAYPGVGNNHGFTALFDTAKRGSQSVCAYAIDIGPGSNQSLGCKTVRIMAT